MKKLIIAFISLILCVSCIFGLCACQEKPAPQPEEPKTQLATPTNVAVSDGGLITWSAVENATVYILKINGKENRVAGTSYQVASATSSFTFAVAAEGNGYLTSDFSAEKTFTPKQPDVPKPPVPDLSGVTVGISGGSEVRSGKSIKLKATVNGTDNTEVVWSVKSGSEFVSVDDKGKVTAVSVDGDKTAEIVATSVANPDKKAVKVITVVAKPELTQAMLDAIKHDKLSFEGYVNISLYTVGLFSKLHSTYTTVIKTAMDGTNWYAQYENGNTGTLDNLFYKNHEGIASQVGVSFMNEEEYFPMLDENDEKVSWTDSGMYNNFKNLTVEDFTFDEETWRYVYSGNDDTLASRVIASANPYDFVPKGFALIIEEGEVMGIYSKAEDDYSLVEQYKAVQELFVALNCGDSVDVLTISKYSHEDIHDDLQEAIDNMRDLTSYTLDYKMITASFMSSGYVQEGFVETITPEMCHFAPYEVTYDAYGEEVHTPVEDYNYGYKKISDNLYNTYMLQEGAYQATRAFAQTFDHARPSFAFAAEIFRTYFEDEEEGTTTYYVDGLMSSVASTFYYGVGNDINLYGIFATEGRISDTETFTPYVVVKDGYIVEACFYFYLGSIYGVIELEYRDFNTAEIPEDLEVNFETRQVPSSWSELEIILNDQQGPNGEDVTQNALDYWKEFYGDEEIESKMPFFGVPLGDTFGFGLTTVHISTSTNKANQSVVLYYDVPLDVDYTIESSLTAIEEYLLDLGFTKNKFDEFRKDGICVAPTDSSLDLLIYVWKEQFG